MKHIPTHTQTYTRIHIYRYILLRLYFGSRKLLRFGHLNSRHYEKQFFFGWGEQLFVEAKNRISPRHLFQEICIKIHRHFPKAFMCKTYTLIHLKLMYTHTQARIIFIFLNILKLRNSVAFDHFNKNEKKKNKIKHFE